MKIKQPTMNLSLNEFYLFSREGFSGDEKENGALLLLLRHLKSFSLMKHVTPDVYTKDIVCDNTGLNAQTENKLICCKVIYTSLSINRLVIYFLSGLHRW